jgi:hypothetical protein
VDGAAGVQVGGPARPSPPASPATPQPPTTACSISTRITSAAQPS